MNPTQNPAGAGTAAAQAGMNTPAQTTTPTELPLGVQVADQMFSPRLQSRGGESIAELYHRQQQPQTTSPQMQEFMDGVLSPMLERKGFSLPPQQAQQPSLSPEHSNFVNQYVNTALSRFGQKNGWQPQWQWQSGPTNQNSG